MVKRVYATVAILAFILCPSAVRSDDNSLPKDLLGFLKPGMRVGVQSVEGTADVLIDVYTEDDYVIARRYDVRNFAARGRERPSTASLVETYPAVKVKLDAFVARLREDSPEANVDDVLTMIVSSRQWFGAISAIGRDYVLIDREGVTKQRCVLARSAIARIDLDAEPFQFYYRPSRER